jgi:hypothetical protein
MLRRFALLGEGKGDRTGKKKKMMMMMMKGKMEMKKRKVVK